ncbi:unnamed protein product [Auanema sp. JU1783]|nr:unnamed protein product [Auanema sp. JU1783]
MSKCEATYEPIPTWFKPILQLIGTITIPVSIYVFWIIYSVTPPFIDKFYKCLLMELHVAVVFSTLSCCFLAPINYMPSLIFVSAGLISVKPFFAISVDVFSQLFVGSSGMFLLYHRLNIVLNNNRTGFTYYFVIFVIFLFGCFPFFAIIVYYGLTFDSDQNISKLLEICPRFADFDLNHRIVFIVDMELIEMMGFFIFFCTSFIIIFMLICLVISFYYLCAKHSTLSETTKKLQFGLLINLLVQSGLPCIVHAVPSIIIAAFIQLDIYVPIDISGIIWSIGSSHCLINCSTQMFFNPCYYSKLLDDLKFLRNLFYSLFLPTKYNSTCSKSFTRTGTTVAF